MNLSAQLYLGVVLFILAVLLLWLSNRQRQRSGLPVGKIIYTDTRSWGRLEKPLFYAPLDLTGKPDYLVKQDGLIIPVEVKTGRAPAVPYDSHVYQLAAYCLLVEKTYDRRPTHGIIHYNDRDISIPYTSTLEASLLKLLSRMKAADEFADLPRSHDQAARCRGCGYRKVCDQSLA
jgi:CRISPR-associated exonuclease Cas4